MSQANAFFVYLIIMLCLSDSNRLHLFGIRDLFPMGSLGEFLRSLFLPPLPPPSQMRETLRTDVSKEPLRLIAGDDGPHARRVVCGLF